MDKEKKVILYGCLNKRTEQEEKELSMLLNEKLNWGYICGQLMHHRLCGYFYINMSNEIGKMLTDSAKTLETIVNAQEIITHERYKFITRIFKKFDNEGIHYAALKGLVYGMTIYPYGARRSNDCDILIWEKDLDKADSILKQEGFVQSLDGGKSPASRREILIQRMNYHDTVAYYKAIDLIVDKEIKIDLNFHFDNKDNDITKRIIDYGTRVLKKDDYTMRALLPVTHFLHLCAHFFREGSDVIWTKWLRDVSLYKVIDLMNTLRDLEDVSQCINVANEFNLNNALFYTLHYLNVFYYDPKIEFLLGNIQIENDRFLDVIYDQGNVIHRNRNFWDRAFDSTYCINNMNKTDNI